MMCLSLYCQGQITFLPQVMTLLTLSAMKKKSGAHSKVVENAVQPFLSTVMGLLGGDGVAKKEGEKEDSQKQVDAAKQAVQTLAENLAKTGEPKPGKSETFRACMYTKVYNRLIAGH